MANNFFCRPMCLNVDFVLLGRGRGGERERVVAFDTRKLDVIVEFFIYIYFFFSKFDVIFLCVVHL